MTSPSAVREISKMSSVSVVIPCYNYGHFLEQAVASVLDDQGDLDVRVLIIDDASPDGSGEVARAIAAREARVEAIVHTTNIGHLATYNEGLLGWAEGDYSVLLSADDRVTPGALKRSSELLDAHPEVGFAYGNVLWFQDGESLPRPRTRRAQWSIWDGRVWLERRFRHGRSGINSPEVVVRTSLQKAVGGYDPRLPHLGDTQMWLRMAARADVGYLRGVDQAYYRRHPHNMSAAYTPLMTLQDDVLAFESVLEECGDRLEDPAHLSDLIRRKVAWEALLTAARAYDHGRTEDTPVEELMAFAVDCWPRARSLPIYRTLQLRRAIGARAMPYLRPLLLPAVVARKAESWWLGLPAMRPLLSAATWARSR
ncbi:glycosyltransferase [Terrabacter sp. NPDC080008]|uniref:glycosyltransferase family 2 protein n=1 Tax=Terrabacter sp. NPDC080008 TaxID=3155176 RepID=UPI00344BF3C5